MLYIRKMAEGVGFEPTVGLLLLLISSQVPLTTQPPFLNGRIYFSRIQAGGKLIRRTAKRVQSFKRQDTLFGACFLSASSVLDPLPGFLRQDLLLPVVVVAVLRVGSQKCDLFSVAQTSDVSAKWIPNVQP
jgi:hypothetical protein